MLRAFGPLCEARQTGVSIKKPFKNVVSFSFYFFHAASNYTYLFIQSQFSLFIDMPCNNDGNETAYTLRK